MASEPTRPRASLLVAGAAQVLTCAADAPDLVGCIGAGVVAIGGDRILAVGTEAEVAAAVDASRARRVDARGGVVIPGFVDCHTHLVFAGSRVTEYAGRVQGESPESLRARGIPVGIAGTARLLREASTDELVEQASERLRHMLACGTTSVEAKSGYGLSTEHELRMLSVHRTLGARQPVEIVSTLLGAHEFPDDRPRDHYLREIIDEMIPEAARLGLARFNDVYCDDGYYTVEESRTILEAGVAHGLRPKIHTDAYSRIGGSALAAELHAVSADHLNYATDEDLALLRDAKVVGVVMPALDFAVAHPRPAPARRLFAAGVEVALATDLCPGCWLESMSFVVQLACRQYGFSPAQALRAATRGAARALAIEDRVGSIEAGLQADLAIFAFPRYEDLAYRLGRGRARTVIKSGEVVHEDEGV